MPKTTPCLWFDTEGEQAATLYTSVFPNSSIGAITRYGADMPRPEGEVLTVEFSLDGRDYVALNGGPQFTFSEAVSFQIHTASQEETDHYWDALSEGGEEGPCGWLKDRFGMSWQVVPIRLTELVADADPARAARAMQSMMQMKRIDIAEIERAADAA